LHQLLCCISCCVASAAVLHQLLYASAAVLHQLLCCISCCVASAAVCISCCVASAAVLHQLLCCISCCVASAAVLHQLLGLVQQCVCVALYSWGSTGHVMLLCLLLIVLTAIRKVGRSLRHSAGRAGLRSLFG
jgi:hypothetical protein